MQPLSIVGGYLVYPPAMKKPTKKAIQTLARRRKRALRGFNDILMPNTPNPASLDGVSGRIGVQPPTLSRWENDKAKPHAAMMQLWEQAVAAVEQLLEEQKTAA